MPFALAMQDLLLRPNAGQLADQTLDICALHVSCLLLAAEAAQREPHSSLAMDGLGPCGLLLDHWDPEVGVWTEVLIAEQVEQMLPGLRHWAVQAVLKSGAPVD